MNRIGLNNQSGKAVNETFVRGVAACYLDYFGIDGIELSIALVDDLRMEELNSAYREAKNTTDVLSFTGEGEDFGEIVISPDQIGRQAEEQGKSFNEELAFILVHGLLHLSGYTDDTEEDRMAMIEFGGRIMAETGMTPEAKPEEINQ